MVEGRRAYINPGRQIAIHGYVCAKTVMAGLASIQAVEPTSLDVGDAGSGQCNLPSIWRLCVERLKRIPMIILVILLLILAIGGLPTWPYSRGWGYYPSGGLGLILVILLVLVLLGRF